MVVATHLDAVDHATVTRADLRAALTGGEPMSRLRIPADGEVLSFAALPATQ